MQAGVMNTSGGPHPAEKWAETTASHIVTIANSVADEKRGAAIKLQAAVYDVLLGHHTTVQTGERAKIAEHGVARLQHDMTPNDHVHLESVVNDILRASDGTPWETDFRKSAFIEALKATLTDHFMSNAFIERSWHADRNQHTPEAKAFHQQFRG
jgi:hypothetical protein